MTIYWYPLYARSRRDGVSEEDAKDFVQEFLLKIWRQRVLAQADEAKGRLRSWLLTQFKNFVSSEFRKANAVKRGAGAEHLHIDWSGAEHAYQNEPGLSQTPDAIYARTWALTLLEEGFDVVERLYREKGKAVLFEALYPAISGTKERVNYQEQSAKLGKSEEALRKDVEVLRGRYKKALLDVAALRWGITTEEQLGEELRALLG